MAITAEHEKLIIYIDEQANKILSKDGDNVELLISLADIMDDFGKVLKASTQGDLDIYAQRYDGFYCFMKVLEELALGLSQGRISVPK